MKGTLLCETNSVLVTLCSKYVQGILHLTAVIQWCLLSKGFLSQPGFSFLTPISDSNSYQFYCKVVFLNNLQVQSWAIDYIVICCLEHKRIAYIVPSFTLISLSFLLRNVCSTYLNLKRKIPPFLSWPASKLILEENKGHFLCF